ncbi:hypothetical protein LIER_30687 [Lithospermum erythrorhizon]|uniref:Uncharacterized protein n=1 Tax=Lithospermum erythrorhizon TaxID=34254 RepID=A0AAV3RP37_LITER
MLKDARKGTSNMHTTSTTKTSLIIFIIWHRQEKQQTEGRLDENLSGPHRSLELLEETTGVVADRYWSSWICRLELPRSWPELQICSRSPDLFVRFEEETGAARRRRRFAGAADRGVNSTRLLRFV